jgi:hypothetical protein
MGMLEFYIQIKTRADERVKHELFSQSLISFRFSDTSYSVIFFSYGTSMSNLATQEHAECETFHVYSVHEDQLPY